MEDVTQLKFGEVSYLLLINYVNYKKKPFSISKL